MMNKECILNNEKLCLLTTEDGKLRLRLSSSIAPKWKLPTDLDFSPFAFRHLYSGSMLKMTV